MVDDLDALDLFPPVTATAIGAKPRCLHPKALRVYEPDRSYHCSRCSAVVTAAAQRRGRTSRNRGNSIERAIARDLGMKRVGQFGGPEDLSGELFVVQVKSGRAFPERLWSWLKALPQAPQTPLLIVTDAPGPGHRRRALVVLDLDDWRSLHGEVAA